MYKNLHSFFIWGICREGQGSTPVGRPYPSSSYKKKWLNIIFHIQELLIHIKTSRKSLRSCFLPGKGKFEAEDNDQTHFATKQKKWVAIRAKNTSFSPWKSTERNAINNGKVLHQEPYKITMTRQIFRYQ